MGGDPEYRCIDDRVYPTRDELPHHCPERLGPGDELRRSKAAHQRLVVWPRDRHGSQAPERTQLEHEASDSASRACHEQRLTGPKTGELERAVGRQPVEGQCRRLGERARGGRGRNGVLVGDDVLGVRSGIGEEKVAQTYDARSDFEARDIGSDRVDFPCHVPADAQHRCGGDESGIGQSTVSGRDVDRVDGRGCDSDPYLLVARVRCGQLDDLQLLGAAESANRGSDHGPP